MKTPKKDDDLRNTKAPTNFRTNVAGDPLGSRLRREPDRAPLARDVACDVRKFARAMLTGVLHETGRVLAL